MVDFLSSSVQVLETEPGVRSLPDLPSAVFGMVGVCERGPLDEPTTIPSYDDFVRIFGGLRVGQLMALELRQAFLNGLSSAIIERVLEGTPATATASLLTGATSPTSGTTLSANSAPFALEAGQILSVLVDGAGPFAATFEAASAEITAGNAPTYNLNDLETLLVTVDSGPVQTITFNTASFSNINAATSLEINAVINAAITGASADIDGGAPRITSDKKGTDSHVEVTGGTGAAALGFPGGEVDGTGDVADITAVTFAEAKTVIEADAALTLVEDVSGRIQIVSSASTGPSSTIQVAAGGTTAVAFGFDNAIHTGFSGTATATLTATASSPGDWANGAGGVGLNLQRDPPSNGIITGTDAAFNLLLLKNGVVVEQFANVNMNVASEAYVLAVVNDQVTGSIYISLVDLLVAITVPGNLPAVGTTPMAGGTEGDTITDASFTGGADPEKGLNNMEAAQITVLAIPDRPTIAVQSEMITFCEVTRNGEVFAVLDPPVATDVTGIRAHKAALPVSEQYALYWPRLQIANPSVPIFGAGDRIDVALSGSVAGMYAASDSSSLAGPFKQPAGSEDGILFSVIGLETNLVQRKSNRDLIFPELINPIRRPDQGGSIYVDGARTGKSNGNFPSVGERRGVSFVEKTLKIGLDFARHKNNDEDLRTVLLRTVRSFLLVQTSNGAFASKNPDLAFQIDTDIPGTGINNASVRAQKKVFIKVGLATSQPGEFIIILVSKDTRALQEAGA